jgi:hypothetical protein
MRALGRCPVKHLAMAQSVLWEKRFACAISSTGSSCRGSHALCAVERRRTRITSRLPNCAHLDTESATSSPSQFVGFITASCIAVVTRSPGGTRSTSILFQSRSGSGSTLGSMASSPWQAEASCRRRLRRHRTFHLKIEPVRTPINALMQRALCPKMPTGSRADDLLSTDRGQSTQCGREHWSKNRTEDGKRRSAKYGPHGLTPKPSLSLWKTTCALISLAELPAYISRAARADKR